MIRNREGLEEYDVRWAWEDGPLTPGLTCVFRVKNEAHNLPWVLPPMFEAVQHIVLVDNQSDDGTPEVAAAIAAEVGASERFTLASYPFRVSRAGSEHLATDPDSVHSLTHFYNWSFAHVRTTYSMKWDGDMVLSREGVAALADLSWQLEGTGGVVSVQRHPLWVESDTVAWLDVGFRFIEPWVYPMGPETTFVKAFEWEVRQFPETADRMLLPEGACVELKWVEHDEFGHWSNDDFDPERAWRKQREWEVSKALAEGRGTSVPRLVRIEAPAGEHVIDHVTRRWLLTAPRPIAFRGRIEAGL